MNTNEYIRVLLKLNSQNSKSLIINSEFRCEFLNDSENGYFFSDFKKDPNCPRITASANVRIFDNYSTHYGKLMINCDHDLNNSYSISLLKNSDSAKEIASILNVIDLSIQEQRYSIIDFMKLIEFTSKYPIKEPYDSCGLTVCEFKDHHKHYPALEFGMDGRLYFEIIDMTNYTEGDLIPLNSAMRKDVIDYTFLTKDNAKELAEKINNSLRNLYNAI